MHKLPCLFQPETFHTIAGDDPVLLAELLEIFLRTVPPATERLRTAARRLQMSVVAMQAHEMRSSLAMVGAAATGLACEQLEKAARRGSDPAIRTQGEALCEELDLLVAQMRHFAADFHATPSAQGDDHAR